MSHSASGDGVAGVAALIGEPARANILSALMSGRALTAGELARHARVTAQTTSGHLARLLEARLIVVERQGRHRYFRLASPEVARAIEALSVIAGAGPNRTLAIGPKDEAVRRARTCYDHIAGQLGLALADSMQARRLLVHADGAGAITHEGQAFLTDFGIDMTAPARSQRPLCRMCLDWSERRHHIAGRLGAALLNRLLELRWVERVPDSRALTITGIGERGLDTRFRIDVRSPVPHR